MKLASFIPLCLAGAMIPIMLLGGGPGSMEDTTNIPKNQTTEGERMSDARTYSSTGHDITRLSDARVKDLASKLDPEAFKITQKSGTERPFCGTLLDNKKEGFYGCVVCGLPLFSSEHKFTSGTGWPSFHTEYDPEHVARITDSSLGMVRTEIECTRCGAHLGHVFPDGPPPTGERHCLNSASLEFVDSGEEVPARSKPALETAYFAGGCFWGIEHYFQEGPGVIDAVSGYMNGATENPTYKDVCSGNTMHAEAVRVTFDPNIISYDQLLLAFFLMHDPTQLNRQGPDRGTQYRSGIYTTSQQQHASARALVEQLNAAPRYNGRIVTEIEPAKRFYPAEDYHQDYIATTGRACHVQDPWPQLRDMMSGPDSTEDDEPTPEES